MSPVLDHVASALSGVSGLIAPFRSDSSEWFTMKYINKNDSARGAAYTITNDASVNFMVADGDTPAPLAVKTWGTLIRQFGRHPEVKYCGVDERTCGFDTRGILYRHRLRIGWIDYIGKESPRLTSAEKQLPDPTTDVIAFATTEDRFREVAVPVLKAAGFQSRKSNIGVGLSVRALADALHKMGHPRASKARLTNISPVKI